MKPQLIASSVRQHADVAHAVDEDAVAVHEPVHAIHERIHLVEDFFEALEPAVGQVARQTADAAVGVGDACARQCRDVLVDVIADRDEVQERRHRAQFHERGSDAGEVISDAGIFRQQRAQVAAARRDLDLHEFLDRFAVGEVVDQRGAVIQPIDVRDQVVPGVRLALLLEAAMQVAAVHVGANDALAGQLGHDLDRAVRRRVRRPDIDDDRPFDRALGEGGTDRVGKCQDGIGHDGFR